MRAVVVYESMYGNTHMIADAIGAGLKPAFDVSVVPVSEASQAVLADADLVVVGGPTHAHGMSRESTRTAAVEAADKPGSDLTVEPGVPGPGLREWFDSLGRYPVKAAAFDTRVHGPATLTGRASKGVTRLLKAHGFDVVAEPESFLVTKETKLEPQEADRAHDWAATLAAGIAQKYAQGAVSCPAALIPSSHADLADCPRVAVLTTIMPDGSPHTSVVWCDSDGGLVRVNTMRGFRKERIMRLDALTRQYNRHPRYYGHVAPETQRERETRVTVRIHARQITVDAIHR